MGLHRPTPQHREQSAVHSYELHGALVIVAQGAYDLESIAPLAGMLETAAAASSPVVLETSGVTFADSTFLNLLLRTHHATDLRIAAPSAQLRRLLEITGADAVLNVRATVADATS
ncbi:STAS domain-containing protein [Streptomyces sp. NPDC059688]|uniref:STAS domain-containing protein n=1 Tax=Streptomyces sp. NPDC059688 TaxID=3346906 RepID=UPI0036B92F07